jgi:4-oxalmesaconate hydratase
VIIDSHAHLVAPPTLYAYRSLLEVSGAQHGSTLANVSEDDLRKSAESNVKLMDEVGTDIQLISPRPFMMINRSGVTNVRLWARSNNELIARTVRMFPNRFRGVAGLPQAPGEPIERCFEEIDYCLEQLGFVGVLLNPDPGQGLDPTVPPLGDPYWFPLYEKAVAMDLPLHVHSGGCLGRETYDEHFVTEESLAITSIARSEVFDRFPTLKIMISHGGGSIPYQIGRWRANRIIHAQRSLSQSGFGFRGGAMESTAEKSKVHDEPFDETLKRFWFDTCLHNQKSLELLFDVVGPERCLFGTEKPGSGSARDPHSGRDMDDIRPTIESIGWLTAEQKKGIFEDNARRLFSRL